MAAPRRAAPVPRRATLECSNTRPQGYTVEYFQANFFPNVGDFEVIGVHPPGENKNVGCHWHAQFRILRDVGVTSSRGVKSLLQRFKPSNVHIGLVDKFINDEDEGIWTIEYTIKGRCVHHPFRIIDASVPYEAHTKLKKELAAESGCAIKIENLKIEC